MVERRADEAPIQWIGLLANKELLEGGDLRQFPYEVFGARFEKTAKIRNTRYLLDRFRISELFGRKIPHDTKDLESPLPTGLNREQSLVDSSETICRDKNHREKPPTGKINHQSAVVQGD